MNCEAARARILEADVQELAQPTDAAWREHLERCPACRAAAERVLEETRALDHALARMGPRMTPEEAVALARRGVVASGARRSLRVGPWIRRAWPALPLAAAAALAGLLLLRPAEPRGDRAGLQPPPAADETMALTVHARDDARMVVFETDDPSITVVWFF